MNFIDTLRSVELVLATEEVPLVVGESGIGKTALAKRLAKENKWKLIVIDGNLSSIYCFALFNTSSILVKTLTNGLSPSCVFK